MALAIPQSHRNVSVGNTKTHLGLKSCQPTQSLQTEDMSGSINAGQSQETMDENQCQLAYWIKQLKHSQPAELLSDRPRPVVMSGHKRMQQVVLDSAPYDGLQRFCDQQETTPLVVYLAAFRAAHFRMTRVDDAVIAVKEEGADVGSANTQCIRITLEDETFAGLVTQVQSTMTAASAHPDVSLENLAAELRKHSSQLAKMALVVHTDGDISCLSLADEAVDNTHHNSHFEVEFHLFQDQERMRGRVIYSSDIFDVTSIRCMVSIFSEILHRGIAQPSMSAAAGPLTGRDAALADVGLPQLNTNITTITYPRESSVPELFRQQVTITPDSVAVVDEDVRLTYMQLDRQSDELAVWLAHRGLTAETLVGVLAPRSCQTIVAFLGILKAGLAYLPLDVRVPAARLDLVLGAVPGHKLVLLGQEVPRPAVQVADVEFINVAEARASVSTSGSGSGSWQSGVAELPSPTATSLAYVMFTSGSTGRPKGVMVEHRGIVRLAKEIDVASQTYAAVPMAHISNLAFDYSTWEIYAALLNGGTLVCIDYMTLLDDFALDEAFKQHSIRAAGFTPALLRHHIAGSPQILEDLHLVIVAGDRFQPQDMRETRRRCSGKLLNAYGPTENTTFSTVYSVAADEDATNGVPIGRAVANSGAFVMDEQQRFVPLAVMGELVVTGDGLARGYTDPQLDRDRFIEITVEGKVTRAYRTGDRVRCRPKDGQLEFFGRMDFQVKLRGNRVELGEIEHALLRESIVADAVTLVRNTPDCEPDLVGFITVHTDQLPGHSTNGHSGVSRESTKESVQIIANLQTSLQARLPQYMVPAVIHVLAEMPINANGKVDRRALADLMYNSASDKTETG